MSCDHDCTIMQNSFTTKKSSVLHLFATTNPFNNYVFLRVPEFHIIGNMQGVTFSDWLISLNMNLYEFMVLPCIFLFFWLLNSFCIYRLMILYGRANLFIHLLTEGILFAL